jgi:hypothetical protein
MPEHFGFREIPRVKAALERRNMRVSTQVGALAARV